MKKLIISTLAAVMVVAFGATAFAATTVPGPAFTDIAGHEAEFELTVMKALAIMVGDAGTTTVRPDDTITRAEVSKVLVTMLGRQSIAAGMAGVRPSFTDEVPTWAWGYVNCAQVMGLIQGYEDGTFKAGAPVTYAETITMLVRAVSGHKEQVTPGFWPYNFLFHAIDYGFTGSVDMGFAGLPCPRGDVARLTFATMQVDRLALTGPDAGQPIPDSAMLAGRVKNEVLTAYNLAGSTSSLGALADSVYLVGAANFESLMALQVLAVANAAGKFVVIGRDQAAAIFSGVFASLDKSVAGAYKLVFADGAKIPYTPGVTTKINGDFTGGLNGDYTEEDLVAGDECQVTSNAAAYIVALRFAAETYIEAVTKSTPTADTKVTLNVGGQKDLPSTSKVVMNGSVIDRDTLAKWDVVKAASNAAGKIYELRGVRQTVQGTPSKLWTTYPGPKYWATFGGVDYQNVSGLALNTSTYYKLGLNAAGQLFIQITATAETPFAVVKGYTDYGATQTVTVDIRGVTTILDCTGQASFATAAGAQWYVILQIDPLTGKVTDWDRIKVTSNGFTVVAVDKTNGTMTLYDGAGYYFVNDAETVIYKLVGGSKVYIGFDGVAVNGTVKWNGTEPVFEYTAP